MTSFAAYFPSFDEPGDPAGSAARLARQRALLARYVQGRGRVVAEFLEVSSNARGEGVVLREARRYCREHGVVLLVAAGGPLKAVGQVDPTPRPARAA